MRKSNPWRRSEHQPAHRHVLRHGGFHRTGLAQLTRKFCKTFEFTKTPARSAITRYDGYVFQRLGDGIVAFFGYPLAHEGEAERAIRAGLDIIDAFAGLDVPEVDRLQVRIGIATGMVVVVFVEKGAVGETMNLASRLQGVAQINTIVVSERVQRLAGGRFDVQGLGRKGIERNRCASSCLPCGWCQPGSQSFRSGLRRGTDTLGRS